jgi:hypothetical protein
MGEDLTPNLESKRSFQNEDEERRFDKLMDTAGKTADEAWRIIESERTETSPPASVGQNQRQAIADEQRAKFAEIHSEATEFNELRSRAIEQEKQYRALEVLRETAPDTRDVPTTDSVSENDLPTTS